MGEGGVRGEWSINREHGETGRESLNTGASSTNQANIGRSLPQFQHEVKSFACDSPQREQVQAVDS